MDSQKIDIHEGHYSACGKEYKSKYYKKCIGCLVCSGICSGLHPERTYKIYQGCTEQDVCDEHPGYHAYPGIFFHVIHEDG